MAVEAVQELAHPLQELQALVLGQADRFRRNIPLETDESRDERERVVALVRVPGNTEVGDTTENLRDIIIVTQISVEEGPGWRRGAEDLQIIFIFADGRHRFRQPDVDSRVCNHASVAASRSGAEWEGMVNVKLSVATLDDEPRLVGRKHRARAMEFCDIQGTPPGYPEERERSE